MCIRFQRDDVRHHPQRSVTRVEEDGRCISTAVRRMFQDVFGSRRQFAFVNFGHVRQAHHVVSVTHRRRPTIGGVGASKQPRDGKRRARRRRDHRSVVTVRAALKEALVNGIIEDVVFFAAAGFTIVVYTVGWHSVAGQEG
eukprot:3676998-Pleurochrysis_carterae.AAC.1